MRPRLTGRSRCRWWGWRQAASLEAGGQRLEPCGEPAEIGPEKQDGGGDPPVRSGPRGGGPAHRVNDEAKAGRKSECSREGRRAHEEDYKPSRRAAQGFFASAYDHA